MYKQPENQAYEVPLCERLDVVPLDARLIIEHKQPEALRLANVLDDDIRAHHEEAAAELRRLHEISMKYFELLLAVHEAFPDESRHQTALRYITQTERLSMMCESAKEQA